MQQRKALFIVLAAGCTHQGATTDPIVTEPVWHLEVASALVDGEISPAAVSYLDGFAADLGLSAEEEWAVLRAGTGGDSLQHVTLQEMHRGVPVLGSEITVHADETTFLAYGGTVTRNLEGFAVEPAVSQADAIAGFKEVHAAATGASGIEYPSEAARLAIRPRGGEGADLVWQLEVLSEAKEGVPPGRWFVMIDAASGEVIDAWNGLATVEQASGPGGNAKVARSWSAQLDVESRDGQYEMKTGRLETYDMKNGDNGPVVWDRLFGGNGDLVKAPTLDPIGDAAINDAHGFAEVTLDMMRDWYGHNSIDDNGMIIVSRVHFGKDYNNAFWDGKRMTYGDGGGGIFYPLSGALDVVGHEINHGFTEKHSNLNYKGMSGGLNESFSDIAGALAEFYSSAGDGDFDVGEDVLQWDGALRYMCDPPKDGSSLDHASQFKEGFYIGNLQVGDGTDVHHSSGLSNKAFCLSVARYVAIGASQAEAVRMMGNAWYLANASYWTSGSSFEQGCQGVVDAARAYGMAPATVTAIHQSWADVGVNCESGAACDNDGTCDVGDGETCFSCASDCDSCRQGCGWFDKAKCKLGIGDCSRCTEAEGCGDGNCAEGETDANCSADCGCGAPDLSCDSVAPYGCWCDEVCSDNGDCCADIDVCQ